MTPRRKRPQQKQISRQQKRTRPAKPSPLLHGPREHVIPTPLPERLLASFTIRSPEHEERSVRQYVEAQAAPETVVHLEKLKTEHLRTRTLHAWDVRTTGDRYWVITNPTNLYSHRHFPSLDFTLSFHVGVTERIYAKESAVPPEQERRLATAWRKWEQATNALDEAGEAEEFQAVGMRCRECLLAFVAATADPKMVPEGMPAPQKGNFLEWTEVMASAIAPGSSGERIRQYLKTIAAPTWSLVSWLTHAQNATWAEAEIVVNATQNVLSSFGAAVIRYESGTPQRCPRCSSYRLTIDYRADLDAEVPLCASCGWTSTPAAGE
jgi:hypothetical protein